MAFKPISVTPNKRGTAALSTFGGVDYASERFKATAQHGIEMSNFIYKDGAIEKRQGFTQLAEIPQITWKNALTGEEKANGTTVHEIWRFVAEDGESHLVAHIGSVLFEIKNIGKDSMTIKPIAVSKTGVVYTCYPLKDEKVSAVVGSNSLWILGGYKFMVLRFTKGIGGTGATIYTPVEDAPFVYIPTTTIAITYKNSTSANRASLDDASLMTQRRKNELISGSIKENEGSSVADFYDYVLDAPIVVKDDEEDANIYVTITSAGRM